MNNHEWKELCLAREILKDIKVQTELIIESNTYKARTTMGFDFVEQKIELIIDQIKEYYRRMES